MLTARDIMTTKVITVKKETTIRELAELFSTHHIGSVPVVDSEENLIGIVSESDLIEQDKNFHIPTVISLFDWIIYLESEKKFEKELRKMTGQVVGDIFSESVETISPEAPINDIADIMTKKRIHSLPVVEGKRIVGVVSRIDLIRTMTK